MEELTLTTPALLFSAISLIMLAYTNRFLAYAAVIRNLHDKYQIEKKSVLIAQIKNIKPMAIRLGNTWSNTIISVLQLYTFLFNKSTLLSKFTLRASQKNHIFNNQKLVQALTFNYTPIEEVLQIIVKTKK